ncbi:oxygenase MpaB family protein [Pedobacter mendelii]|uniref:ER-bound oxygenase mpaB/mpaB'/Rubber oxygenase catalytic domain-containing protein n=1 Tax=Pedobacter mendelii TaxID=1908240 RepID=A0ABQ2BG52_9SPHI|nr:oxygenase MpaB family protein [Pedobacter mendelii]GGI23685.1 hypothetical protein GCM10008119_08880 [Pedobacter mendelii]
MTANKNFNDDFLNIKRQLGDQPADEFIKYVFSDDERKLKLQQWLTSDSGIAQLSSMFPGFDFINDASQLPVWANPELIKNGSAFFAKNSQNIMSLLGLLSLPYCYTAANGAMVLYLSERIRKHTTKRLYDTAVFVWEVMGPSAFSEGGNAFSSILKVRIMHAAVRFYTLQSGKWNNSWGTPVNQEDMAGTNLSFSLIVVRGLRKLGISISNNEQIAFLHIWKVVGYFTGLNEDLLPENGKMATQLDLSIKNRQFETSKHGQELTKSLIDHILTLNKRKVSNNDILGLMRYLLGFEIADMLGISAPELPRYKLTLIRTTNFFKSFMPEGDSRYNYHQAYSAFKKQNPVIQQKN